MSTPAHPSDPASRRVLVVAYFFPPVGGIGVERTLKHVTYLPEFGWAPVVVGPANSAYRLVDPGSLARIPPGVPVLRAPTLEPAHLRRAVRWLMVTLRGSAPDGLAPSPGRSAAGPAATPATTPPRRSLRSRANGAWERAIPLVFFPDDQVLWEPPAVVAGLLAVRRHRPDAIYSSSPPVSGHLVAGMLKTMTGLPWVADFRDPWIGNSFARPLPAPYRRVQAAIEGWIVRRADVTVFATERLRALYAGRYPQLASRFAVIHNGYDPAELARLPTSTLPRVEDVPGSFRLVYAGSVYGDRELGIFLDGVQRLLDRRPEVRDRLRVEFFGWLSHANRLLVEERFPALHPVVRHLGVLSRDEALARVASADAGLVLLAEGPDRDLFVGAKAYDYIGLDRQVLAVAPPGELREILRGLDWGVGADPSAEGVALGLERMLELPPPTHRADPEGRFDRRALAGRLATILDEVSRRRGP